MPVKSLLPIKSAASPCQCMYTTGYVRGTRFDPQLTVTNGGFPLRQQWVLSAPRTTRSLPIATSRLLPTSDSRSMDRRSSRPAAASAGSVANRHAEKGVVFPLHPSTRWEVVTVQRGSRISDRNCFKPNVNLAASSFD